MEIVDKIEGKKIWTYLAIGASLATVAILVITGKEIKEALKAKKDKEVVKEQLEEVATETLVDDIPEDQKSGCAGCSGADGNGKNTIVSENNWITS